MSAKVLDPRSCCMARLAEREIKETLRLSMAEILNPISVTEPPLIPFQPTIVDRKAIKADRRRRTRRRLKNYMKTRLQEEKAVA